MQWAFDLRMQRLVRRTKSLSKLHDVEEFLVPGEPDFRRRAERCVAGIPMAPEVIEALQAEANRAGIPFPALSRKPVGAGYSCAIGTGEVGAAIVGRDDGS